MVRRGQHVAGVVVAVVERVQHRSVVGVEPGFYQQPIVVVVSERLLAVEAVDIGR
jgi:hypothetical protein